MHSNAIGTWKTLLVDVHQESNILQRHTAMQAFQLNLLHAPSVCSNHFFFSIFGVTSLKRIIFKYKFHYPGKGTGGGGGGWGMKQAASL